MHGWIFRGDEKDVHLGSRADCVMAQSDLGADSGIISKSSSTSVSWKSAEIKAIT